ncbi:MAG TPA: MFS transporter [Steroidobacteraceae bacterium]|nr:MFS transporter [Steroidobacteraceae bacterium]
MTFEADVERAASGEVQQVEAPRSTNACRDVAALGGLFLCGALAFGVGAYAFTQFLGPLATEFGWGRAALGGLMSAFWLAAPFAVVSAYLLDGVGIRALILIGGLLEALGAAGMTLASEPKAFYLLRFCMGVGKVVIVTPIPATAARIFPRRPGLAIAITFCGWHVGGLIMAPLTEELIASLGWRHAMVWMSTITIVGICVALAMLGNPRRRGVAPIPPATAVANTCPVLQDTASRLHTTGLIVIGLSTIVFYLCYTGLLGQLSPLLSDSGFSSREVGVLTGSVAISGVAGVLLAGGITQWLSTRVSGSGTLLLMGITAFGAALVGPTMPHGVPYSVVILLGALMGGGDPILIDALRRSIFQRQFAKAYGWWYLLCLCSCAAGPYVVGAAFDKTGNYHLVFNAIATACITAGILWICIIRPSSARSA